MHCRRNMCVQINTHEYDDTGANWDRQNLTGLYRYCPFWESNQAPCSNHSPYQPNSTLPSCPNPQTWPVQAKSVLSTSKAWVILHNSDIPIIFAGVWNTQKNRNLCVQVHPYISIDYLQDKDYTWCVWLCTEIIHFWHQYVHTKFTSSMSINMTTAVLPATCQILWHCLQAQTFGRKAHES